MDSVVLKMLQPSTNMETTYKETTKISKCGDLIFNQIGRIPFKFTFIQQVPYGDNSNILYMYFNNKLLFGFQINHNCGVMVSMLISSAVDRGFEPRSGQTIFCQYIIPL